MAFEDWAFWLILVIELLLVTLVLYLSMRFICNRKKLDGSYFFRLFGVALILVIGVVAVALAIDQLTGFMFAPMFYVFLTIGFILVIRYLLTTPAVIPYREYSLEKYWHWAIWITIISLLLIFLINFLVELISDALGHPIDLVPHF
ncbi:MAG: hypothetical protein EU542_06500 [Promethearchaeota archaeon]|jgi:hypothetical protein|nr:MAG: hypothetical protein EU542_06500 [Candidatus Lokiarchaeota archaeon]